jgi:hypothetical protein
MLALVSSASTGCKNCSFSDPPPYVDNLPVKHLLLPLLQYPLGVGTIFEDILEGFAGVLRWNLDCWEL